MKRTLLLLLFVAILLLNCADKHEKGFYGTYYHNDSINIQSSRINFYPNNIYSFNSSSCLSRNRDSGEYKLNKDTIYFKSINLHFVDSIMNPIKPLTGYKFIYKEHKVFYINRHIFPDKTITIDTTCWTKDTTMKLTTSN